MRDWNPIKIIEWLKDDWKIKLASFFLSLLVWFFVDSLSYEEISLSLPVQYKNLASDLVVLEDQAPLVALKIRGQKNILRKTDLGHLLILKVNLSQAKIGVSSYPVELINLIPKSDLHITIESETIHLHIDQVIQKNVLIKPRTIGSPKEGFVLESIDLSQNNVLLEGPSGILTPLTFIETSTIDISKSDQNLMHFVTLIAPPKTKIVGKRQVSIQIRITEQKSTREEIFPVKITNLSDSLILSSKPEIKLLLTIPGRYQKSFKNMVKITADCSKVRHGGSYRVPITVQNPDLIEVLNIPNLIPLKFLEKAVY